MWTWGLLREVPVEGWGEQTAGSRAFRRVWKEWRREEMEQKEHQTAVLHSESSGKATEQSTACHPSLQLATHQRTLMSLRNEPVSVTGWVNNARASEEINCAHGWHGHSSKGSNCGCHSIILGKAGDLSPTFSWLPRWPCWVFSRKSPKV